MPENKYPCKGCSGAGDTAEERIKKGNCYYNKNGYCMFGCDE